MKAFRNPVFAAIVCAAAVIFSSVFSTRVKLNGRLERSAARSAEAFMKTVQQISDDSSRFPGNVLISCAGIEISKS